MCGGISVRAYRVPIADSARPESLLLLVGIGEEAVQAFTDFGIENLIELVRFHKQNPQLLRR